jgi:hypothetical protein
MERSHRRATQTKSKAEDMKAKASDLIFVSQIKRDGSGTMPVSEPYIKILQESEYHKDRLHDLHCLSITEGTYIICEFNSFVVKLNPKFRV